ncbi:MAG: hypothetical protein WD851_09585 [Pirellulales bacterium]
MPFEESPDPLAAAKEAAWLAVRSAFANVGRHDLIKTVEFQFDAVAIAVAIPARGTNAIGREKVEVFADVNMVLSDVAGGNADKSSLAAVAHEVDLPIPCCLLTLICA